jgi:hypothetical protein
MQEEMAEQRFSAPSDPKDGGNPANIAASGASNQAGSRAAVYTNERAARLRYSRQSALQLAASE